MGKKKSSRSSKTEENQLTRSQITPTPAPIPSYGPNTIALSSDMSTIYLIDSGRAIPFSLNAIGGVLIGEIKGQITIVSALDPLPTDDKGMNFEKSATERATGIPVVKAAKIPTNRGNWNFIYIRERRQLCIIGAVDIEVALREENQLEAQAYLFDLREGFINVQKVGNTLLFETIAVTG